ncbi:MAG TPA: BON domain-containing protein [Bryobacteraceae bacterium]|nr:BON domain-containing protein [Bryobacteraceae bacterium]
MKTLTSSAAVLCLVIAVSAGLSLADKRLSMAAHNVKIISRYGAVTLKGAVKTDEEKKAIEDKATELAGAGKVTSEIAVAHHMQQEES